MTSQVDMGFEPKASPKLPVLREGHSSMVCQDKLPSPPTPREQAAEWALDVRTRYNFLIMYKVGHVIQRTCKIMFVFKIVYLV
jgi:hypothetical protein